MMAIAALPGAVDSAYIVGSPRFVGFGNLPFESTLVVIGRMELL